MLFRFGGIEFFGGKIYFRGEIPAFPSKFELGKNYGGSEGPKQKTIPIHTKDVKAKICYNTAMLLKSMEIVKAFNK